MPVSTTGISAALLSRGSGIPGRRMADGFIEPRHYGSKLNRKYIFEDFSCRPMFGGGATGNGAATGATGDVNLLRTNRGQYEWHVKGAGQTLLVPVYDVTNGKGLDFAQDQASTEGHELAFSPNIPTAGGDRGLAAFVAGQDDPFFARVRVLASDWSGVGTFFFGFRRVQAYATALATYSDYFGFKVTNSGATGLINTESQLNTAGVSTVSTTQTKADNVAATFEIRVKRNGAAFGLIDGGEPTVPVKSFVYDVGDILIPVAFFLHSTDLADNFWYQEFEAGYLPQKAVN